MTDKEAIKLALEALEACYIYGDIECVMTPDSAICLQPVISALKERLSDPMREVQKLGQEIEQAPVADYIAARDMLDAKPVPPRTWVGLTDEDMYVVSEEESCSFIAGAKWSEAILKEKNT